MYGHAVSAPSFHVVAGLGIDVKANYCNQVKRLVRVTVTASMEPHAIRLARRDWYEGHTSKKSRRCPDITRRTKCAVLVN
jgi:hypothetical protein